MARIIAGFALGLLFSFCCVQYGLWDQERESKKALNDWLRQYEQEEAYEHP